MAAEQFDLCILCGGVAIYGLVLLILRSSFSFQLARRLYHNAKADDENK